MGSKSMPEGGQRAVRKWNAPPRTVCGTFVARQGKVMLGGCTEVDHLAVGRVQHFCCTTTATGHTMGYGRGQPPNTMRSSHDATNRVPEHERHHGGAVRAEQLLSIDHECPHRLR